MKTTIAIIAALAAAPATAETQWRLGMPLASYHMNADRDFNELNLGLSLSVTFRGDRNFQYGFQVGAYNNSFHEITTYGLAFADWQLFPIGDGALRVGGYGGFFGYANLAPKARDMGWPTWNNHVLVIGSHVKYVAPNGNVATIAFIPMQSVHTSGVVTFSVSVPFGGQR
jgi:hypothetical protein